MCHDAYEPAEVIRHREPIDSAHEAHAIPLCDICENTLLVLKRAFAQLSELQPFADPDVISR